MIKLHTYENKNVGIIGFGKTGKSVVDALILSGANVFLYDDFPIDPNYSKLFTHFADFPQRNLSAIVASPGINLLWPHPHPAIDFANRNAINIISDIDLFMMHISSEKNIIAVTGTNGKSTTTAMIHHVLSGNKNKSVEIGGNFGIPVLNLDANFTDAVIELSSYNLELSNVLGFNTAILLNITADHLTRHGGMLGYIYAKQKIFGNFTPSSCAIIGIDDDLSRDVFYALKNITRHKNVIPISGTSAPDGGVGWVDETNLIDGINSTTIKIDNALLKGAHNRQNIAAAYATCCCANHVDPSDFAMRIMSFKGISHRQEIVANTNGVLYVNDSKATNVQSVEQALMRFENIIWILGGRPKEDGVEKLTQYFHKIKYALLIGETAEKWHDYLVQHKISSEIVFTLQQAVKRASELVQNEKVKADVILLSPACASFDQFTSFEERGDLFKELVLCEIKKYQLNKNMDEIL